MCLSIPGKILEVQGKAAIADFNGEKRKVSLEFCNAKKGEYVLVAGGLATDTIPEKRAIEMLEVFASKKE